MSKNNGGCAFPRTEDGEPNAQYGMSLRDYFAAKAMQAYFTDPNCGFSIEHINAGTEAAYRIADSMLKAREE